MLNEAVTTTRTEDYVDHRSFSEYLDEISERHRDLYDLLDRENLSDDRILPYVAEMNAASWVFEGNDRGGRGPAWSGVQKNADNRSVGMTSLLRCFSPHYDEIPGPDYKILDVLGGSGAVAHFASTLGPGTPSVFTADLSDHMMTICRARHLPYVRQSAARSLFRDNVLDGVLIAYGSQLLPNDVRRAAVREAWRTLKPNGRLVFHAFEVGSGIARFFDEVIHPYSRTGHPHSHYTRAEILDLFSAAGFRDLRFFEISDPFTLRGGSPEEARTHAILHLYKGYDLIKLATVGDDIEPVLAPLAERILGPIAVERDGHDYVATVPRTALVAVGIKA